MIKPSLKKYILLAMMVFIITIITTACSSGKTTKNADVSKDVDHQMVEIEMQDGVGAISRVCSKYGGKFY